MKHPQSLSCRRDFARVLREGERVRTSVGTAFVTPSVPDQPARLGLVVPASVGGAVDRNRIKRRVRAAFRAAGPRSGVDIVFRAHARAKTIAFQELEEILTRAGSAGAFR